MDKKPGRPRKYGQRTVPFNSRGPEELKQLLLVKARREGLSLSEAIIAACRDYVNGVVRELPDDAVVSREFLDKRWQVFLYQMSEAGMVDLPVVMHVRNAIWTHSNATKLSAVLSDCAEGQPENVAITLRRLVKDIENQAHRELLRSNQTNTAQ